MPTAQRKAQLKRRFDRVFDRSTRLTPLDRLLRRLHARKSELLTVLDRPEVPLHTNASERDIRSQVTRRKLSGGTVSDRGRDCRDGLLGLMTTCDKLGVSFWDHLGDRLAIPDAPDVPPLPDLIRARAPLRAKPASLHRQPLIGRRRPPGLLRAQGFAQGTGSDANLGPVEMKRQTGLKGPIPPRSAPPSFVRSLHS